MSLIIDAIKKAQELRWSDQRKTPFFKEGAPRCQKRMTGRTFLWVSIAAGGAVSLFCYSLVGIPVSPSPSSQITQQPTVVETTESAVYEASRKAYPMVSPTALEEEPRLSPEEKRLQVGKTVVQPLIERRSETVKIEGGKSESRREIGTDKASHALSAQQPPPTHSTEIEGDSVARRTAEFASRHTIPPIQNPEPTSAKQGGLIPSQDVQGEMRVDIAVTSAALTYFNQGVEHHRQGDYPKAIQAYRRAIDLDPACAEAYNNLGILYQEVGDSDRALLAYEKAIEVNPRYEKALNNLGVLLYMQSRLEESYEAFQKALAANPNNVESHVNLGIVLKKQGRLDEAIECFNKALSLHPLNGEAHYNAGLLYEGLGQIERAIDHYQKFVRIGSKAHPELAAQVGRHLNYLLERGRMKRAK